MKVKIDGIEIEVIGDADVDISGKKVTIFPKEKVKIVKEYIRERDYYPWYPYYPPTYVPYYPTYRPYTQPQITWTTTSGITSSSGSSSDWYYANINQNPNTFKTTGTVTSGYLNVKNPCGVVE